ncbi:unnamed protein product [Victoria cruziana]
MEPGKIAEVYPLTSYYFGSKEAKEEKDEFLSDRIVRMKSNFMRDGLRRCVEGIILVEQFKHPHVLVLQIRNSFFRLPGGRLRPGETEIEGLKRKLSSKLSPGTVDPETEWQVEECVGMWWRTGYDTIMLPYCPSQAKVPKECLKVFLVKHSASRKFKVPKNMKLLAVPFFQLHDNAKTYGPIISSVPEILSRFSFNFICN